MHGIELPAQETWLDCATADGGYVLHLAPRDATWFMDGYWPSVHFAVDGLPTAWVCES
ncbi:hypothetical protein [Achromobacter agilis]|uniref:hypothetical protein n=1 Tax=Achromobacter agilis TaxID=1353888 RepID=UPI0013EDA957|nr:hypothetical protein [Achromobacter agilis]